MKTNGKRPVSGSALRGQSRRLVCCPETGNCYLMRRGTLTDLINCNVLPENFVARSLEAAGRESGTESELTDRKILEGEQAQRALITVSMLEPRIVEEAAEEDEIEYPDIPLTDRLYLFRWLKGELPEVPIETEGGETTVGAVENFPAGAEGAPPAGAGADGEDGGGGSLSVSGD